MSKSPVEMREYIMSAPTPCEGPRVWERAQGEAGYEMAALCAAKALLIVCEENPRLLDVPSKEDDPRGVERAFHDAHWQAAKARWPGLNEWLGGITGFQFGWANAQVRYVMDVEQVGNPAVMTVSS